MIIRILKSQVKRKVLQLIRMLGILFLMTPSNSAISQHWNSVEEFDEFMDSLDYEIQEVRYTDPDRTYELTQLFYKYSDQEKDTLKMAYALNFFSVLERDKGNYEEAIKFGEISADYYMLVDFLNGAGGAYNNLANIFKLQGNNKMALENYKKALDIFHQESYSQGISIVLQNYIELLIKYKKFDEAKKELFDLNNYYKENPDSVGLAFCYNAMANLLISTEGNKQEAKYLLEESIRMLRASGREKNSLKVSVELASLLFDLGENAVALDTINNILPKLTQMKLYKEEALALYWLGYNEHTNSNYLNSLNNCENGLKILEKTDDIIVKAKLMKLRYQNLEALGKFEKAYLQLIDFKILDDSIKAIEDKIAFENLYAAYDNLKKEEEINKLKSEKDAQLADKTQLELKNRNQLYTIWFGSIILFLSILFGVLYIRRYRSERNLTFDLKESLLERDLLNKEIHHRVKNNLQIISSLLDLQIDSNDNQQIKLALTESQSRIQSMALIHENLYKSGNLKDLNFKDYVTEIFNYFDYTYDLEAQNIEVQIDVDSAFMDPDKAIPLGLIINECFTNTIKHAFEEKKGGIIKIVGAIEDGIYTLIFEDNGKGLGENSIDDFPNSIGVNLIKGLVKQIKGNLSFESNDGLRIMIKFSS